MRGEANKTIDEGFIRRRDLKKATGLSPSTIDRLERNNHFPSRRKLTPCGGSVGWLRSEVDSWRRSREKIE